MGKERFILVSSTVPRSKVHNHNDLDGTVPEQFRAL
jgi:hypothetical protein